MGDPDLRKRIFRRIEHTLGLIKAHIGNAQAPQHIKDGLAVMAKSHCPMVGEVLFNEHMAIEPTHLGNGKHADAAKGAGRYPQHLALCHIATGNPPWPGAGRR